VGQPHSGLAVIRLRHGTHPVFLACRLPPTVHA